MITGLVTLFAYSSIIIIVTLILNACDSVIDQHTPHLKRVNGVLRIVDKKIN